MNRSLRIQLLIAFFCLALVFYFAMLARTAVALIRTGTPPAVALGVGVLILPVVGAWVMVATLRAGLAHQRLARIAAEEECSPAVFCQVKLRPDPAKSGFDPRALQACWSELTSLAPLRIEGLMAMAPLGLGWGG